MYSIQIDNSSHQFSDSLSLISPASAGFARFVFCPQDEGIRHSAGVYELLASLGLDDKI